MGAPQMEAQTPTLRDPEMTEPDTFISSSEESNSGSEKPKEKILKSVKIDEDLRRRLQYDDKLMKNCKQKRISQVVIPAATPGTSGYKPPKKSPKKCPEENPRPQKCPEKFQDENPWNKRKGKRKSLQRSTMKS